MSKIKDKIVGFDMGVFGAGSTVRIDFGLDLNGKPIISHTNIRTGTTLIVRDRTRPLVDLGDLFVRTR